VLGVVRAAGKYDPNHRTRWGKKSPTFCTYAVWWMRAEVGRELGRFRGLPMRPVAEPPVYVTLTDAWADEVPDHRGDGSPTEEQQTAALAVERLLGELDDRSREVVRMRLGLGEESVHRLHEIGRRLGVTKERARQIHNAAMWRLQQVASEGATR